MQLYVDSLKILDGELVLDYFLRALKMSQESQLQADKTGQNNRLIQSFVTQVFNMKILTEFMRPKMAKVQQLFRTPDNHLRKILIKLQEIYETDIKKNAPQH